VPNPLAGSNEPPLIDNCIEVFTGFAVRIIEADLDTSFVRVFLD
jgi:hypothetical protein